MQMKVSRSEAVLALAGTVAITALLLRVDDPRQASPELAAIEINALPPTSAGIPTAPEWSGQAAPAPRRDAYMGGTKAAGRVSEIYLKVGQNVFLALDQAPAHLRNSAERWVEVEFPDLLANGSGTTRALIDSSQPSIAVGDVVEIKFAHKESRESAKFFPVKETTRVTELVAKRDERLAADYERRIHARTGQTIAKADGAAPGWLRPSATPQNGLMQSLQTASGETR